MIVRRTTRLWTELRALVHHRRVQLALSLRVTIAALASLALAQLLQLPLPLWAVLTAVIVTQMSVGRSLKATFDYLVGTVGGAIYGGAVAVLVPHSNEIALLAVLALAVGPLALIAAINPRFSVAPITAIIVLLIPIITHAVRSLRHLIGSQRSRSEASPVGCFVCSVAVKRPYPGRGGSRAHA